MVFAMTAAAALCLKKQEHTATGAQHGDNSQDDMVSRHVHPTSDRMRWIMPWGEVNHSGIGRMIRSMVKVK